MSELKRRNLNGQYKAKIALETMRGTKTVNEIAQEYGVHSTQVGLWKMELDWLKNVRTMPVRTRKAFHLLARSFQSLATILVLVNARFRLLPPPR